MQAWFRDLDFSPGRYRTASGQVVSPFGTAEWSTATIFQGYVLVSATPAADDAPVVCSLSPHLPRFLITWARQLHIQGL